MPKLNSEKAAAVEQAESEGGFEPWPDGTYTALLQSVEVKSGAKGPYWSWEFKAHDDEPVTGRQWVNTSLSPDANWKMKEMFEAFGVPADTDTDELCGQPVLLVVKRKVIDRGARKGEIGNDVVSVKPLIAADGVTTDAEDVFDDDF